MQRRDPNASVRTRRALPQDASSDKAGLVKQGAAVSDAATNADGQADADNTYSANEKNLINFAKADIGTLKTQLNALLASLRVAGVIDS